MEITVTSGKLGSLLIPLVKGIWGTSEELPRAREGEAPRESGRESSSHLQVPPWGSGREGSEKRLYCAHRFHPLQTWAPLLWVPSEGRLEQDCWASET